MGKFPAAVRLEGEGRNVALRQEEFTSLCDDVDLDRDRALVERCQAGDSAAFGNLYARYYERLLRFCLRRLNDRHEAEDAAQEAFARAWKALPRFAGERRFYPWLTVIAGNICTDMLRRRSRSTPVGVGYAETSDEVILAAVDGELVNKALDRLSVRHRHVLAMREGSGWTYQQIADHEGVEIGTIETLLWRARQALKREFTVLSESKGALAGFLVGTGALVRRGALRVVHRSAELQSNVSMGSGGLRNALAGVAVTSAAVAAAIITPHALSSGPSAPKSAISAPADSGLADPILPIPTQSAAPASSGTTSDGDATASTGTKGHVSLSPGATKRPTQGAYSTAKQAPSVPDGLVNSSAATVDESPLSGLAPVAGGLGTVASGLIVDVNNLASTLGLGSVLSVIGLAPATSSAPAGTSQASTTTTTTPNLLGGLTNTVQNTLNSLLGQN
jgi:RNA polymerase sigma-70 factor (ECF subfamily)